MNDQQHPGNPEQSREGNPGEESQKNLTPSEAPNASFEAGAEERESGFDSPPVESMHLSNPEYYAGKDAEAEGDVPPDEYEDVGPV